MNNQLIKWSHKEFDELPWRKKRSLYGTLVSEIMLQQTTVATVLKHYDRFLKVFPNLESLARVSEEEVCAQWQGLGYYRRARNLRKAAVYIVEELAGEFPLTLEELKKIPGVGDYTASALLAMGMNKKALAIDANIERIMARLFLIEEEKGPKLQKFLQANYEDLAIPFKKFSPREINESLMDLGRVYCQAKRADCALCPLRKECKAAESSVSPLDYPRQKQAKKKESHDLELLRVIVTHGHKVLAYEKNDKEWLSGQLEVPTLILRTTDKKLAQYPLFEGPKDRIERRVITSLKTAITKYKIKNQIVMLTKAEFEDLVDLKNLNKNYKYYALNDETNHFSTTTHKCLAKLNIKVTS